MNQLNPDRVVKAFKSAKRWAYKHENLDWAWLHVSRTFGITVAEVKRLVYEAKPKKPEPPS